MSTKFLIEQLKSLLEESELNILECIAKLDTDYSEKIYIGEEDGKYGIYNYEVRRRKFNGDPVWGYRKISELFNSMDEAIKWFADYLLKDNSIETIRSAVAHGYTGIYNDQLKSLLGITKVGKKPRQPMFIGRGDSNKLMPVPDYMRMPKGAQRNTARNKYMQLHGKSYEDEYLE